MAVAAESHGKAHSSGGSQHRSDGHGFEQPEIERGALDRLARTLVPIFHRRSWKRLRSSITAYRAEITARDAQGADLLRIEPALGCAERLLAAGDIDGGWKCFLAAQRIALLNCPDAQAVAVAKSMRAEADKLGSWRRAAVLDLLKEVENKDAAVNPPGVRENVGERGNEFARLGTLSGQPDKESIVQAALLRDEHYHNEAYKNGLRRSSVLWIAIALSIGIVVLCFLAWDGALLQTLQNPKVHDSTNVFRIVVTVAVFGFLGAIFSAAISIPALHAPTRIPELAGSIRVTALRLFIGPVSAVIIWLVVQSKVYATLYSAIPPDGATILIIAFVAGFTERLVSRVVETVAGRSSSPP